MPDLRGIPIIGGPLDDLFGFGEQRAERDQRRAAAREADAIGSLEEERSTRGELLSPEMFEGEPELYTAEADPESIEAQRQALRGMSDVVSGGGLTAIDRARIARAQAQERGVERGQREAIMQQMQARGMGGSGADLAQRLAAQQGSANRTSQAGLDIESMAQQRALQAMQSLHGMGSGQRQQSFGEAGTRAEAIDRARQRNVEWRREVPQRTWGQGRDVAAMKTRQYTGQQDRAERAGARSAERRGQVVGAIGQGFGLLTGGS